MPDLKPGIDEGDVCNRDCCAGLIERHPIENCSCHINPPCSSCTDASLFCENCGWEEQDDWPVLEAEGKTFIDADNHLPYTEKTKRKLDPRKIDYIKKSHTHFSMIVEGVYPEGTTRDQVHKLVAGTFGGRFAAFGNGTFKYIAYTD